MILPLSNFDYKEEKNTISKIVQINGFNKTINNKIVINNVTKLQLLNQFQIILNVVNLLMLNF